VGDIVLHVATPSRCRVLSLVSVAAHSQRGVHVATSHSPLRGTLPGWRFDRAAARDAESPGQRVPGATHEAPSAIERRGCRARLRAQRRCPASTRPRRGPLQPSGSRVESSEEPRCIPDAPSAAGWHDRGRCAHLSCAGLGTVYEGCPSVTKPNDPRRVRLVSPGRCLRSRSRAQDTHDRA